MVVCLNGLFAVFGHMQLIVEGYDLFYFFARRYYLVGQQLLEFGFLRGISFLQGREEQICFLCAE